ncbi:hypothetical protein PIB30_042226 [Stylosanthes scabra]|uniref:Replication protein A 70 kDa DNA-binding subunit B/D first OB fold domain-containing protein n=1 Tax=Stylosanthes scabra TaxID=79078 RepID=A0ABU6XCZ5_9FABA|nr:hypothetical protein [Stylosanthes scabra]
MANVHRTAQLLNAADRVADVKATKLAWNLVVGVVHMYQLPCQNNPSDYYSIELVLQDREGDRIQCSISKADFVVYSTLIREFGVYNMKGFIVQNPGRGSFPNYSISWGCCHDTSWAIYLIDCIGQVVGKEEIVDMVTRTGEASKRMAVHLEDLEGNVMKCTLFGAEMIGQLNEFLLRGNVEPVVMIAQLFKPNYYLNETSIQSTYHSSRILFNSEYPEFIQFKERRGNAGCWESWCLFKLGQRTGVMHHVQIVSKRWKQRVIVINVKTVGSWDPSLLSSIVSSLLSRMELVA